MNVSSAGKRAGKSKSGPAKAPPVLPNSADDLFWQISKPGSAFEQHVVGILVTRADGTIAYVNSYLAALIGASPADVVGKSMLDFASAQDATAAAAVMQDCLSGKRSFAQFESRVIHKDGTIFDILVNASAADFEGQPTVIGVVIDISARKQMELALAASEMNLQTALSNMLLGLAMFDPDYKLILSNPRFAEIFLLPKDRVLMGLTIAELMALSAANSGLRYLDPDGAMVGAGTGASEGLAGSYIQQMSDGRIIADTYRQMPDGGLVITFEDITRQRKSEQALATSEAQFQAALANMSQGLVMYDATGKLLVSNARFAEIFKFPHEKALPGMTLPEVLAVSEATSGVRMMNPDRARKVVEAGSQGAESGYDIEHMSDGGIIAATYRRMPDGGLVTTFVDITQQRAAEQSIATSEAKLQAALANMSQGLLMLDKAGKIILANTRFAEIFRFGQDQVLPGMTIPDLFALSAAITGRTVPA